MATIQKRLIFSLVFIGMVLAFSACQPDPEEAVVTEKIIIENVPVNLFRTEAAVNDNTTKTLFKVFAQLSDGFTPKAKDVALGYAVVSPTEAEKTAGKMTVTIENWREDIKSGDWAAAAIIISPDTVNDIFDIDLKTYSGGAGDSSSVTFDWKEIMSKHSMVNLGGLVGIDKKQGMENIRRLYGEDTEDGRKDGIICYWDNKDKYGGKEIKGSKTRADPKVIDSIDLFNKKND